MTALAMYRLPYADHYTVAAQTEGKPEELHSIQELDGRSGFVIAPFCVSADEPLLLLHPDRTETLPVRNEKAIAGRIAHDPKEQETEREHYAADFAACHERLADGTFSKIVLARRTTELITQKVAAEELFMRACCLYPRMFVALVHTERSGTWLTATPEILLEGNGGTWRTVALAGTMRLEGQTLAFDNPPTPGGSTGKGMEWNEKNRKEQRIVADYIEANLRPFANTIAMSPARTVRAGDIVHLRSDFSFIPHSSGKLGSLLNALHPTPAVCGLPKKETQDFILNHEHSPRSYYSGFMGPLNPSGETHLYVSLRCMQICNGRCHLYAGGGLLTDSTEAKEWAETEAKMATMRRVLGDIA